MSREYEFLKECGYFYVLTINKDFPDGRPFGAVMDCLFPQIIKMKHTSS